ncbi:MAG: hypothetical protein AAFQ88_09020 [Pseudomonadota bacterium]
MIEDESNFAGKNPPRLDADQREASDNGADHENGGQPLADALAPESP